MQNPLIDLSQSISEAVHIASHFVVAVSARRKRLQSGILLGSNRILTVDPGVELDEDLKILLPSGEVAAASLLGRDPGSDLSLLELQGTYQNPPSIAFAEQANLGELVLNVSLSQDTGPNVALGIVAAVSGPWRTWKGGKLDAFIKLDSNAPGSVAIRADGAVLGLATDGLVRGSTVLVPNSNIERFLNAVDSHANLSRGYLGVGLQPVPQPAGMIILSVEPDSPSAAANLMVGDVIVSIGGLPAGDFSSIQEFLEPAHVGHQIPLRVFRAGNHLDLEVQIGTRPNARRVA